MNNTDMNPTILNRCGQVKVPTPRELQYRAFKTWQKRPLESMQLYKVVTERLQGSTGCSDIQADVFEFPTYQYMDIEIDNYPDLHEEATVVRTWLAEQAFYTSFWQKDSTSSILRICWDIRVIANAFNLNLTYDYHLISPCNGCNRSFNEKRCHITCLRYKWTAMLRGED